MQKVLISGGSGLLGSRLSELLEAQGYQVAHLSRKEQKERETIVWDITKGQLDAKAIEDADHIIHLAGAGIIDEPWTEERMQFIRDSRIKSAELLREAVEQNKKKPVTYISASSVGYYGFVSGEHVFSEEESFGNDYLGKTCKFWENSADEFATLGISTAKIRIGIVLTKEGGALREMEKPIRRGFAAALGSGKQYIPWIHIDDLCRIFIHALDRKLEGTYNAAAPYQMNNNEFTKVLAKTLGKKKWLPNVPRFVLQIILGKRALLVLEGSRVSVKKIQSTGFEFKYEKLEEALSAIYGTES